MLSCLLQAIQNCASSIIALEVIQSVERLVKKYGKDTYLLTWEIILNIVHQLVESDQVRGKFGCPGMTSLFHFILVIFIFLAFRVQSQNSLHTFILF